MRKPVFDETWPEFVKTSYKIDELELWGSGNDLGYAYSYYNRRQPVLDAVQKLVPPGGKILDVAAAGGNFTLPLTEKGFELVWNDLRAECKDWVQMKYEFGNVEYILGNILDSTEKFKEKFDAVIATEVIEHVAHPDDFLKKLAIMVKSCGLIFLTTPNGQYFRFSIPKFSDCDDPSVFESTQFGPDSDDHIFLLYYDEIKKFAEDSNLAIETFAYLNNPLSCGHVKLSTALRFLPRPVVDFIEMASRKLPMPFLSWLHSTSFVVFRKL